MVRMRRAAGPWDASNDDVVVAVDITSTNTGIVTGDDVVLLVVEPPAGAVALGAPRQQVVAFARTTLPPHASRTQQLTVTKRHLRVPPAAVEAAGEMAWVLRVDNESALYFHVQYV